VGVAQKAPERSILNHPHPCPSLQGGGEERAQPGKPPQWLIIQGRAFGKLLAAAGAAVAFLGEQQPQPAP
jgi:hypothetical protein